MSSIAFITQVFPSVPFIYKEVIGLRNRGVSIKTFSIRKNNVSQENNELISTTIYLLPLNYIRFIRSHGYFIFLKPQKYIKTLLFVLTRNFRVVAYEEFKKQSIFKSDRVRTFIHFLEGVYFAKLLIDDATTKHIHAHFASHSTTIAMVASMLTNIPFSFTAHAYDIWFDKLFIEEKVNTAKFVITCTKFGKKEILKNNRIDNPNKIITIYHGVDTKRFVVSERIKSTALYTILTVGRLTAEKAQKNLISVCKILSDEGYAINCFIIGDGPQYNYLQSLISDNQLEGVVHLTGRIPQEEINSYYQNADIFVLPSISENLPNVLLESLASGLPVIASKIAAIPELITHMETGLLVQPNDIQGLVNAIKLLMQDRDLANQLSENGRRHVCQNFDEEASLDKIVNLWKLNGIING